MSLLVGDKNGISLWNKMVSSVNPEEQQYLQRLNDAAQKYGKIYFSDYVEQIKTKHNQATYSMVWDGSQWKIDLFLLPEGAQVIDYDNLPEEINDDSLWQEIDPNDLILVREGI